MDAKVIRPFYDLHNPENSYNVGDTFSGTESRVSELAEKGFVEKLKTARKRTTKPKE